MLKKNCFTFFSAVKLWTLATQACLDKLDFTYELNLHFFEKANVINHC